MIRVGLLLLACALLASCGALGGALGLGGPKIAANVQAGQEPRQAVIAGGDTRQTVIRPQMRTLEQSTGDVAVRCEAVERIEIQHAAPWWLWALVVVLGAAAAVQAALALDDYFDRRRARRAAG